MSLKLHNQLNQLFDDQLLIEIAESIVDKKGNKPLLCGSGEIGGSLVYFFSQDGDICQSGITKLIRLYKLALKNPAPVIGFYNASGMNLSDGIELLDNFGELLNLHHQFSGKSLQVSVITGNCIGINAIMASAADIVLMSNKGYMYPTAAPQGTSETLGSPNINALSGTVQATVKDSLLLETTRRIVDMLINPIVNDFELPEDLPVKFKSKIANLETQSVEIIIKSVADKNSLFMLYELFGRGSTTAFARLGGQTVAIAATNGKHINGEDSVKIARVVQLAGSMNIPVITFINSEGLDQSDPNSTRDFAKLSYIYAHTNTPKFVVCTGKVYGSVYLIFAGKGSGSDSIFAWKNAIITPLSPTTSIAFLKADIISQNRKREDLVIEYIENEASASTAAQKGIVDTVIDPKDTRKYLADALKFTKNSYSIKKQGNIPF